MIRRGLRYTRSLLSLVLFLPAAALAQTELFFSEYVEGSSVNKALEIFNGTGAAVDLAAGAYKIEMYFNGSASPGTTVNLTGVVANNGVYVVADDGADAAILAVTDQTSTSSFFNGDDAVVLRKGSAIIDVIGQVGFDPGSEWGSGLVSTADNTIRRKESVLAGDTNETDAFDPSIEWDGFAQDTFSGLSSHTVNTGPATFVRINELDSDTPSTDMLEFVELYDGGAGNTALDGLVLVFFNGSNDFSYEAFDLDGFTTDTNGFFLLGNSAVSPTPSIIFSDNFLQNGADAVALYAANATDFPNGTAVTTTNLVDAIVYDTDDADDAGLLVLLNSGQPQLNENGAGDKDNDALARVPDGGVARNTDTYVAQPPTPNATNVLPPPVVINELDSDTPSTDMLEFVELYDGGAGNTSLDGLVIVFYNGSNDLSYAAFDLDGFSTDANGFFLMGNASVTPAPSLVFGDNLLQNGADAIALHSANASDFPNGTAVTTTNLLDAIVYDTDDADDTGLLVLLNSGQPQVNENAAGDQVNHANARVPNGGTPRNTDTYVAQTPTPGASNIIPPDVVINELDSDTPGSDNLEFIELFDGGDGNTALDGLVIVFYNGSNDLSYAAFDLDGFSTDANGFFLMGNGSVSPTPALIFGDGLLQNGADAAALYVGDAADFPNGSAVTTNNLIDAIVYDTDDAGLLVLPNSGQPQVNENGAGDQTNHSSQRIPNGSGGGRNTDTYDQFPPTPSAENIGPPPPVMAEIFEIQGNGLASPFVGQVAITENNVVTALASNGFFMQTPASRSDGDASTSDGIFVFTGAAPSVSLADLVNVTGEVIEFFNFTELGNSPTVSLVSSGNPLPPVVAFDAATPSPNQPQSAIEFERFEGMRIAIAEGSVSGPNQDFSTDPIAEVHVVARSGRAFREKGIEFPGLPGLPVWDGNPEVFELDPDRLGLANQIIPAGSTFEAEGVLGFEFSGYELWPTSLTVNAATLPEPVRDRTADEFTLASLNLFRLFDDVNDGGETVVSAAEYARRLTKFSQYIRDVLDSPDILAVQEAEKIGVLQALSDEINGDDASVVYAPYLEEGNDVGGIDVGFLVRNTVQVNSLTQLGAAEIFTFDGSLLHDRPPLLLQADCITASGLSPITVIVVHNRSLSGIDDPVDGPRVRQKRLEQAQSIAQKIQDLQDNDPDIRLAVVGDFNAYEFTDGYVDAVGQIKGSFDPDENLLSGSDLVNPDLTDQILSLPAGQRYSFIFQGSAQVLDHALTSVSLNPAVTGFAYGRGNADAAEDLLNNDATPLRSSDHDGLVLFVDVTAPTITVAATPTELWPANHKYETFELADFVTSVSDGNDDDLTLADVFITSVDSDEPEDVDGNGDGSTMDDIVIVDCQTVQLRAEREGSGNGRVYTVHLAAADASGNLGTASYQFQVPKSQGSVPAIDDGPVYTEQIGCTPPNAKPLADGSFGTEQAEPLPTEYGLSQNYPNPFNPETTIRFQLPEASHVSLRIFNVLGNEVRTLTNAPYPVGYHSLHWNGRDSHGNQVTSGLYFYRLESEKFMEVKKMSLVR